MTWEDTFVAWKAPSSATEQEKQANAESMIKEAIRNHAWFQGKNYRVYVKGSYANRTNVRLDSDVDVVVESRGVLRENHTNVANYSDERAGLSRPAAYTFAELKNEVGKALIAKFGLASVTRGKKAFDIDANSYRVQANVVPCLAYRYYYADFSYREGTIFDADGNGSIVGYPQQQYDNGVAKNSATAGRYKDMTRILKRLRNKMADEGIAAAGPIASFLIECLCYRVPNSRYGNGSYYEDMRQALTFLYNGTKDDQTCNEWCEVNDYRYLFRPAQPWTRQQVRDFVLAAWRYVGFTS